MQASLRDPLELGYFACREVNVSFATVNTHGISAFSAATEVAVHGGEMIHWVWHVVATLHSGHQVFISSYTN